MPDGPSALLTNRFHLILPYHARVTNNQFRYYILISNYLPILMIPSDELFERDGTMPEKQSQQIDAPNQNPTIIIPAGCNEELAKEHDYQRDQSNGKESDDASAHRSMGANSYTQRNDQKDQLQNLHIGGSETEPQGGNNHTTIGEQAQGPGFTDEGSYELGAGLRMHDQKFGDDHTSGPALKPQDETSN